MKIKLVYCILILIVCIYSCKPYKFIFVPIGENSTIEKWDKMVSKYLKNDELYLTFTKGYDNTKVKFYENDSIKFDSLITTASIKTPGIAKAFKIKKKSLITIKFESNEKPLTINSLQMKGYKFIYISKIHNKYEVEFNNETKRFLDYPKTKKLKQKDTIN